jgi:hypothetical protein
MDVYIIYMNGSSSLHKFNSYGAAMDFCRDGISYSGNRVRRVQLVDCYGSSRAIWDIEWNALSQHRGLRA